MCRVYGCYLKRENAYLHVFAFFYGKMNQTLVKMVIYKEMRDRVKGKEIEARLDFSQCILFYRLDFETMHKF